MPNLLALLRVVPDAIVHGDADVMVLDVASNSHEVQPMWMFVAIRGERFDGHDAIAEAIDAGASVVIGERPLEEVRFKGPQLATYVQVSDTRRALSRIVHLLLDEPSRGLHIYGVTGTNGKTTCATLLEQVLAVGGHRTGFIGTTGIRYGNTVIEATHTTPHARALCEMFTAMKADGVDAVAMEVSSHALHQHRVGGIAFSGAVFTNLTRDHLDYHGTMDRYAEAKKMLFDGLPTHAVAVVWGDDPYAAMMVRDCKARRILKVGEAEHNDVLVTDVKVGARGTEFTLVLPSQRYKDNDVAIATPLIGRFNVANAALCAVLALQTGMSVHDVRTAMRVVRGPAGRMERMTLSTGAVAVVDYAHTPDALEKALAVLREILPQGGALHVVFGCGGDRDAGKRPLMGRIAAAQADVVWLTSDNPRNENPDTIIDDIRAGIADIDKPETAGRVRTIVNRKEAIAAACSAAGSSDIVLIAGKGHETVQIVGSTRLRHSDIDEVSRWDQTKRG